MSNCAHPSVSCINPYEYIRKYRCNSCGEVMMCACEEEFARRFLPHQLSSGTELATQQRVRVTLGFQNAVCNACRRIPQVAHPKAPLYGRGSKIRRYYWREIAFDTIRRFGEWADSEGYSDWTVAMRESRDVYASIEREVVVEIKALHRGSPKYAYQEESEIEVLTKHQVEVIALDGAYIQDAGPGVAMLDGGELFSAEEFAARHFQRLGYEVILTESVPFHLLFGIFMWLLIQDPSDPKVRTVGFGDRSASDEGKTGKQVWTLLPEDFGTSGYAVRRAAAIRNHFRLLPNQKQELLWTFDYWIEPSADLRQYLWAHRPQDIQKAREVASVLPSDVINRILGYLVADYWRRYCGWPDLFVHTSKEFFFAEVKSSKDKLSEDQKNWIRGNNAELGLPFKLVKIHRKNVVQAPPTDSS